MGPGDSIRTATVSGVANRSGSVRVSTVAGQTGRPTAGSCGWPSGRRSGVSSDIACRRRFGERGPTRTLASESVSVLLVRAIGVRESVRSDGEVDTGTLEQTGVRVRTHPRDLFDRLKRRASSPGLEIARSPQGASSRDTPAETTCQRPALARTSPTTAVSSAVPGSVVCVLPVAFGGNRYGVPFIPPGAGRTSHRRIRPGVM